MDERRTNRGGPLYWLKRRSWRFWTVMIALLPLFYVASFGPACWIVSYGNEEMPLLVTMYQPLLCLMTQDQTQSIRDRPLSDRDWSEFSSVPLKRGILAWYSLLGAHHRICWRYRVSYDQPSGKPAMILGEQWVWGPKDAL